MYGSTSDMAGQLLTTVTLSAFATVFEPTELVTSALIV